MKPILLLGRAGSGKTRYLLDRLVGYLTAGGEGACLLLLPNLSQADHVKRLLLSRYSSLGGFFDQSIVTFTSLAERILPHRPIGELLSGIRRDLLLRRALRAGTDASFRRLARHAGFRRAALELLKEMKQNGYDQEELLSRIDRIVKGRIAQGGGIARGSDTARRRLTAFRELLASYEKLREAAGALDHEDYLRLARDRLAASPDLLRTEFLGVDGFQNFTRLERDLLLLLSGRAEMTLMTLPWGREASAPEDDRGGSGSAGGRADGGRQFRVSEETLRFLSGRGFRRRFLAGNRRTANETLQGLERSLFEPVVTPLTPDRSVRVLEGADPEDEADRVARTVMRLVRGEKAGPYRYREILLVVRDAASARRRFTAAFRRHRLPLRIFGKEPLAEAPLVCAALHLLELAAGRVDRDRVMGLLRSGRLRGVSRSAVDLLEIAVIESGEPEDLPAWAELAGRHSPAAGELLGELAAGKLVGGGSAEWIFEPTVFARECASLVERCLSPLWEADPEPRGEVDQERIRREAGALSAFTRALAEVGAALFTEGQEAGAMEGRKAGNVGPAEFFSELHAAVRESGVGSLDRRLDVVNLVDAREARQWEAPVVIVSGLVEGEFPRSPREDIFLTDRDREAVNRSGNLALRERLLQREEEYYLFYVAVTRARDRLFLTYPATDGRGRETLRSFFLTELLRLFSEEDGEAVISHRRLADPLPVPEECADGRDLRCRALLGIAARFRPGTREEVRARRAAALHDLLIAQGDDSYGAALRLGSRFRRPPKAVLASPERLLPRHGPGHHHSASTLEDFVRCPFLHFAKRTLKLRRASRLASLGAPGVGLDHPLLGEIAHEVLRRVLLPVIRGEEPGDLDFEFEKVFTDKMVGGSLGLAEEMARRELRDVLHTMVDRERERLRESPYRPAYLEWSFRGLTVAGDAVLEDGEEAHRVLLTGQLDRVDLGPGGALVIDYKYSKKGFDKKRREEVREGAHLQLPIYLLAVAERMGEMPVGAWLYPLREPKTSGYVIGGGPAADDPVALSRQELTDLLAETRRIVLELDMRIRAGEIEVRPRNPKHCQSCDFRDLCRRESWAEGDE